MFQIINSFITVLSLGLFCIGVNYYIDLHLGYEFLSIAIALEVASVLIAVAVSKNMNNLNIDVFSLAALAVLVASAYILFAISFTTIYSYFIALLCVIVPVVLISVFLINVVREITLDNIIIKNMILSSFAGLIVSVAASYFVYNWQGIGGVFMLSSAALTFVIILLASTSNVIKISALCLFVGVLLYVTDSPNTQLANWSLSDKPVSKNSLSLLKNPEQRGWLVEKTIWKNGSRVDILTTKRSRNEGNFWTIHDANILVPYVHKANSSITWWEEHYPLMILPFELMKPSRVLTIATVRGADADIAQQFYGAETTSIYNDCLSLKGGIPCNNSALNKKLIAALNTQKHYDLVSFSNYNDMISPFAGANAQHEAIHTIEVFQNLYDSLNDGGLLAINARNQTVLRKTLSYVWRVLSKDSEDKVIKFEKKIRVLAINKYNLKNDAYNYLVLVSKDGFTTDEFQKLDSFVNSKPVSKIMYDSGEKNIPATLTVSSAVLALTKLSSRDFKKFVNLEPSSILKPDYFYLSKTLHPFFSTLSAIFLSIGIYALIFTHGSLRHLDATVHHHAPGLSKLLIQALLSTAAFALLLFAITYFISAALGYSSLFSSLLIISTLTAFAIPHVLMKPGRGGVRILNGLWLYPVILLICALILITMNQGVVALLGTGMQAVFLVLAISFAFCSGLIHRQTVLFIEQLYSDVNLWFWIVTSVGMVLGVILAKYILINYDLEIVVKTAMILFVWMAFIAWWSLAALQGVSDNKANHELETPC